MPNQRPFVLPGAMLEQILECPADVPFFIEMPPGKPLQGRIVFLARRASRLQIQCGHGLRTTLPLAPAVHTRFPAAANLPRVLSSPPGRLPNCKWQKKNNIHSATHLPKISRLGPILSL